MFRSLVRLSSIVLRSGNRAPVLSSAESLTKIIIMGNFLPARSEQILLVLGLLILPATFSSDAGTCDSQSPSLPDNEFSKMTDAEWRQRLTPEQFYICRQKGTEPAFTGEYVNNKQAGIYKCAACGAPLFESETKFDSGSGWPSFFQQYMGKEGKQSIVTKADHTLGMSRTEVLCAQCHSHLGHVFPDGPAPTGLRYCINSVALKFEPEKKGEL